MSEESMNQLEHTMGPEIHVFAEPTCIKRGEPVAINWHVEGAEEATLWISASLPDAPEPLNWVRIAEIGETVPIEERIEQVLEVTTAFYIVAKNPLGISGRRVIVEVAEEIEPVAEPETWSPQKQFLPQMEDPSQLAWVELSINDELVIPGEVWHAGSPPNLSLSASPQVIFIDENATLSWKVTNANCATMGFTKRSTDLVADGSNISGTKPQGGGWGAGGMPHCGLTQMSGSWKISGQSYGHGHQVHWLSASNVMAKSASASRWLDILSIPKYKGAATQSRKSDIRSALKTIDNKLLNGAVYNDSSLDSKVPAFKNNHLNRKAFWARLVAEIENIELDTFHCKDVADKDWGAGHWTEYANEIVLEWSPKNTPWLAYVIVHELMHKCGFNSTLKKWGYSKYEIEQQCHTVSKACIS
jgi:hypothetical protein